MSMNDGYKVKNPFTRETLVFSNTQGTGHCKVLITISLSNGN